MIGRHCFVGPSVPSIASLFVTQNQDKMKTLFRTEHHNILMRAFWSVRAQVSRLP